jgi:hypothetical protein
MLVIDADTHIDETENTWEYMREEELQFKPTTGYPAKSDPAPTSRYWLIDGQRQNALSGATKNAYHQGGNFSTCPRACARWTKWEFTCK